MSLRGDRVLLRPVVEADVDVLSAMFAEPAVAAWWPRMDRDRVVEEILGNDDEPTTVYTIEVAGEVAGVVQSWEEPEAEYRKAGIDIALRTRWHGRGVAVDALRTLIRHLVDAKGHHHLTIDPAAANPRAIACYAKVGFRPVGILRNNEMGPDGTFRDTLLMDLLAEELPPATPIWSK